MVYCAMFNLSYSCFTEMICKWQKSFEIHVHVFLLPISRVILFFWMYYVFETKMDTISFVKICKTYRPLRTGEASNPYIPMKNEHVFSHLLNVLFFKMFLSNS